MATEIWVNIGSGNELFQAINTPFTQVLRPLCLPCTTTKLARLPLKAQRGPQGCLDRSRVAQRTFRILHGRYGRCEILSMFKTVAQRSLRRLVAHRSLKGGRMKVCVSPWSQNRCTWVGHWSPHKIILVVPLQQFSWFNECTRVVLQQLHRNRSFWFWVTTEHPGQ